MAEGLSSNNNREKSLSKFICTQKKNRAWQRLSCRRRSLPVHLRGSIIADEMEGKRARGGKSCEGYEETAL